MQGMNAWVIVEAPLSLEDGQCGKPVESEQYSVLRTIHQWTELKVVTQEPLPVILLCGHSLSGSILMSTASKRPKGHFSVGGEAQRA